MPVVRLDSIQRSTKSRVAAGGGVMLHADWTGDRREQQELQEGQLPAPPAYHTIYPDKQ